MSSKIPVVELRHRPLLSVREDIHSRKNAYIVTDRSRGQLCLLTQKLPYAAAWLSDHVVPDDRVHVASLYEAASKGRLVHRRFGVVRTTLADAPRVFAQAIEDTRARNATVRSFVLCYPHNLKLG